MTDLEEKFHEKEESVNLARKKLEEEYICRQKELEFQIREAKAELSNAKEDAKNKFRKLEGAMDEELEISCPPSPKNDAKSDKQDEELPNYELGKDMWKQLARVSIAVFGGDKRSHESWKAAFMACIDKASATAEYKLLQLKNYHPEKR